MPLIAPNIPEKTVERLSEYRRTLLNSYRQGVTHIFSHVLAGMHGITAVQVRRDLMLIGFSSDTKKGYDVKVLIDFIGEILDSPEPQRLAVIGMGHIGIAISRYCGEQIPNLSVIAAFDNDPAKVGAEFNGVPCYHTDQFEEIATQMDINIVLLSVPTDVAHEFVLPIINAGIKGVFNFTSAPINFPRGIAVENFDITTVLEKLAYFVKDNENNEL